MVVALRPRTAYDSVYGAGHERRAPSKAARVRDHSNLPHQVAVAAAAVEETTKTALRLAVPMIVGGAGAETISRI